MILLLARVPDVSLWIVGIPKGTLPEHVYRPRQKVDGNYMNTAHPSWPTGLPAESLGVRGSPFSSRK